MHYLYLEFINYKLLKRLKKKSKSLDGAREQFYHSNDLRSQSW